MEGIVRNEVVTETKAMLKPLGKLFACQVVDNHLWRAHCHLLVVLRFYIGLIGVQYEIQ